MSSGGAGGGAGAAASVGGGDGGGPIDISSVPPQQLQIMGRQLQQEIQALTSNYSQLKQAQGLFKKSKLAVQAVTPASVGKDILVPLSGSLYVPGKFASADELLVDVGTGYYVGKTVGQTAAFLDKKVSFLNKNTERIAAVIEAKQRDLRTIETVLQARRNEASAP